MMLCLVTDKTHAHVYAYFKWTLNNTYFLLFNNFASMDAFLLSIFMHVQYWEGILNKALIKVLLQFCLVFCNVYIAAFCAGNWSITYKILAPTLYGLLFLRYL